jgi:hypothetical protein
VIEQEFFSMSNPFWFEQSIEIFIVEKGEGVSRGTKDSQRRIKHFGNLFRA